MHLALPLGHFDGLLLTAAFLGSGAAYAWLAMRALEGRTWRLWSALLLGATLIAYLVVSGTGGEEPDQVGIATALVELVALGLCLVPARRAGQTARFKRFAGSAGTILVTLIIGVAVWVGSFAAHAATDTDVSADPEAAGDRARRTADDHEHAHDHAARAQAGVIMRAAGRPPSDRAAAGRRAGRWPTPPSRRCRGSPGWTPPWRPGSPCPNPGVGPDVHLDNKANRADGRTLDPEHPETLVYAITGSKATLLGVVFVMDVRGRGRRRSRAARSPAGTRTTSA